MKWFVIPATLTCGLNSMLAALVLSLCAYNLSTENTNTPIEAFQEWIHLVRVLLPFSCCWLLLSLYGIYVSMTKRQTWTVILVLMLHAVAFGFAIYFVISFGNELEKDNVQADTLFKDTLKQINSQSQEKWIPQWLDNIQKQSKRCCGIRTYRDYEEFWPGASTHMPPSCCKNPPKNEGPCPNDLSLVPFPETPEDFFKIESGCIDEIMELARHHFRQSHQNSIIMATFIGCGLLAYLLFYTRRQLDESEDRKNQKQIININTVIDGGDSGEFYDEQNVLDTASGPLIITSSGQVIGSMGSVEAVQALGSVESVLVSGRQQPITMGAVLSGTTINKPNVATGVQQQYEQQPQQLRASQQHQQLQQFEKQNQQSFQEQQQNQQLLQQQQQQNQQFLQQQQQQQQQLKAQKLQQMQQLVQSSQQIPFQQQNRQLQQLPPQQLQQPSPQKLQQLSPQLQELSPQIQQLSPQLQQLSPQLQQLSPQQLQQLSPQQLQQLSPQQLQQLSPQLQQLQQLQRQQFQQSPQQLLQQQNQRLQQSQVLETPIAAGTFGISFAGKRGRRGREMRADGNPTSSDQIAQQGQNIFLNSRTRVPQTASADNLAILTRTDQPLQDLASVIPPGNPGELRKKNVRRDALPNRNNKQ